MTAEALWEHYFYDPHGPETLGRWARVLRVFRFCRAHGGHANDGDLFFAAIRYSSEAELLAVFDVLGLTPERVPLGSPQPEPGIAYTTDEFNAFPSVVSAHRKIRQPGHVRLNGSAAYVWAGTDRFEIHFSDAANRYDVSEAAFEAARRIEPLLAPLADRVIDPPLESRNCLCPVYYPEVWTPRNDRGASPV